MLVPLLMRSFQSTGSYEPWRDARDRYGCYCEFQSTGSYEPWLFVSVYVYIMCVSIHGLLRALTFEISDNFDPSERFQSTGSYEPWRMIASASSTPKCFNPRALTSPDPDAPCITIAFFVSIHGLLRALTKVFLSKYRITLVSIHGLLRALTWYIETASKVIGFNPRALTSPDGNFKQTIY